MATARKILEDSNSWFLAQEVEREIAAFGFCMNPSVQRVWKPPWPNWVKCNIGYAWNRNTRDSGASWVVRNFKGKVLVYGRRSFPHISSKFVASFVSLVWAVESICTLGFHRVLFGTEDNDLIGAVLRPQSWPSFKFQSVLLLSYLGRLPFWNFAREHRHANLGAFRIADSVTSEYRLQSYIVVGAPVWLKDLFASEEIFSSLYSLIWILAL